MLSKNYENYYLIGEVSAGDCLALAGEWRALLSVAEEWEPNFHRLGDSRVYRNSIRETWDAALEKIADVVNAGHPDDYPASIEFTAIETTLLIEFVRTAGLSEDVATLFKGCFACGWHQITKGWTRVMLDVSSCMTDDEFKEFKRYIEDHLEEIDKSRGGR